MTLPTNLTTEQRNLLSSIAANTIDPLNKLVAVSDPYTARHHYNVAHLALQIAKIMKLDEWRCHGIYFSGLIHDLGKVAISKEILWYPGSLTEEERIIIKRHPQLGETIVESIEVPWPIKTVMIQHHERLNGSGYPAGLKGDAIILESRIIAVADVLDSMVSWRPYKSESVIDVGLQEIAKFSGVLFDSDVVTACQQVLRDRLFSYEK